MTKTVGLRAKIGSYVIDEGSKDKKAKSTKTSIKENKKEHNPNWPNMTDLPYRILIVGGSGSVKTNLLLII